MADDCGCLVSKSSHDLKMINQNRPNHFQVCVVLQTCNFKVSNDNPINHCTVLKTNIQAIKTFIKGVGAQIAFSLSSHNQVLIWARMAPLHPTLSDQPANNITLHSFIFPKLKTYRKERDTVSELVYLIKLHKTSK